MERAGFYRTLHGTPPPSDKPRCVVCGDESSGIHYGVNSCEGCKGFFRRCMVKGMHQKCSNNEECEITRFARNSCQFCRLKKCVRMGMSRSASKVGRRPKSTSVLLSDVATATAAAERETGKKLGSRAVCGPRRSQSVMPALTVGKIDSVAGAADLRLHASRRNSTASSVYERVRSSLEGLRTSSASPFVTAPYSTPSSSRAPSISGVDSWQETADASTNQSTQVIDYSLAGNYQGYAYQHRSSTYPGDGNSLCSGADTRFRHLSATGESLDLQTEWMSPDSEDSTSHNNLNRKTPTPSVEGMGLEGAYNSEHSGMEWSANTAYQQHSFNAVSSYYREFYPNGPQ